MLDVLYLAANIGDATVAKRVQMFADGGADVAVAGFRRSGSASPRLNATDTFELGETFDARFGQRILAIARAAGPLRSRMRGRAAPDVIVARNLEMLFLASRLQPMWEERPAIVYECLDIHRLLLRNGIVGQALRGLERRLARRAALLMTSSPAFVREYFEAYDQVELPTLLIENKVYGSGPERGTNPALRPVDGPLRIGWFGALRCRRSLLVLADFAARMNGAVEIVLRGRPALTEFDDFHGFVATQPHMSYEGTYRNPDDLAPIYSGVHLSWAIDYFEAGQNSKWLLPNRVYEGCLHGAVPVALEGTETATFLGANGIGIVLPDTAPETLVEALGSLGAEALRGLAQAVAARPASSFAADIHDARILVGRLAEVAGAESRVALEVAA